MNSKYTFIYSESIERLLDGIIAEARARTENSGLAKYLEFVLLGGGYGRGEGGVWQGGLYNDLDFFVISKDSAPKSAEKEINAFFEKLSALLSAKIKIDADFSKAAKLSYIKKRMGVMSWREMAMGSQVVFGSEKRFREEFGGLWEKTELLNSEMLKLAMNRLSGLVFARQKFLGGDFSPKSRDFIARNINKARLASGDILLASDKNLPFKVSSRLEAIERGGYPEDLKAAYKKAAQFKASPAIPEDPRNIEAELCEAAKLLSRAFKSREKFLKKNDSAAAKIKNFLLWLGLAPEFKKLGAFRPLQDPRSALASAAVKFLQSRNAPSPRQFSAYKKIWERLA